MSEYVYILINSSLPGMLKIGKTDRTPEIRAEELSRSTNMPTSFIVAYEEEVHDSTLAEKLIHEELTNQGYRVNDKREFFSIPLKNAIEIVSLVANAVRGIPQESQLVTEETIVENEDSLAEYYLMKGLDASTGSRGSLQNDAVAVDYFEKAISLGSVAAYNFLASQYILGQGVRRSADKALEILKEGGDKGSAECFRTMWSIYAGQTIVDILHENNAELCYQWFLESSRGDIDTMSLIDYLTWCHDRLFDYMYFDEPEKVLFSELPGRHKSKVIKLWISKIQEFLRRSRECRMKGEKFKESFDNFESDSSDLMLLEIFASKYLLDSDRILRMALSGFEAQDLSFPRNPKEEELINYYAAYMDEKEEEKDEKKTELRTPGFFSRLFSKKN